MAETTKETKAQRAKKYRTRRLLVGAAGLVLCVGVAFGIDGVVTARADSALADALAAATDLQVEQHQSVEQAAAEGRTAAAADLTAYVAEAGEKADAALQKAAEEAKKAKAAEEARKAAAATSTSTELPGGQKSSGSGRALTATKTGGNFKASVYNGNTGASNIGYYQSLNSDVKAWLKIPGTNINYPVLQNAYEDHYYLHRGLDRGQSYYGVLWTQTATQFGSADSLSSNTVIYGHNWKNCRWNAAPSTYYAGQQMFESLLSYHHTGWAEQYPYLYYSTPNEEMAFVIFACFYTEGTDWYINAEGNIDSVISGAKSRSRHNFGVDVNSGDKLITFPPAPASTAIPIISGSWLWRACCARVRKWGPFPFPTIPTTSSPTSGADPAAPLPSPPPGRGFCCPCAGFRQAASYGRRPFRLRRNRRAEPASAAAPPGLRPAPCTGPPEIRHPALAIPARPCYNELLNRLIVPEERHELPGPHPQFLHHRPYRPRQKHPRRPHSGVHRGRCQAGYGGSDPR